MGHRKFLKNTIAVIFATVTAATFAHDAMHTQDIASTTNSRIVSKSAHSFDETVNLLRQAIENKGMTIFATIDHKAAAEKAGLTMQPATVLIYGTPKVGTAYMVKDPLLALQLPLKVLITETNDGVIVSYASSEQVVSGSIISAEEVANTLANAEKLIEATIK